MFVNKVYLHEQDGKLSVEFVLNADFQTHLDLYDQNGELTDVCNDLGYYFSKVSAIVSARDGKRRLLQDESATTDYTKDTNLK